MALPAMVLYSLASGGLALLVRDIVDGLLPQGDPQILPQGRQPGGLADRVQELFEQWLPQDDQLGLISGLIVGLYVLKGIGSYFSVYLMADAGKRVVRDLRTE